MKVKHQKVIHLRDDEILVTSMISGFQQRCEIQKRSIIIYIYMQVVNKEKNIII